MIDRPELTIGGLALLRPDGGRVMMTAEYLQALRRSLEGNGIALAPPLSESELDEIEQAFGFRFPPDLRMLLAVFVPEGDDFPDWHQPQSQDLLEWLDFPSDGIAFDVEESGYWGHDWDEKPDDLDDAIEEARRHVALAPILIPVYSNQFVPARPAEAGNPVLEVMQSVITIAAPDLGWWFRDELGAVEPSWERPEPKRIEFWSGLRKDEG